MEYQKIINLLDNTPNQPSKFKTKNWVEINGESQGTDDKDNWIRFKTLMLRSSLCDYSDAHLLVKVNVTAAETSGADAAANYVNENVIFKDCD